MRTSSSCGISGIAGLTKAIIMQERDVPPPGANLEDSDAKVESDSMNLKSQSSTYQALSFNKVSRSLQ